MQPGSLLPMLQRVGEQWRMSRNGDRTIWSTEGSTWTSSQTTEHNSVKGVWECYISYFCNEEVTLVVSISSPSPNSRNGTVFSSESSSLRRLLGFAMNNGRERVRRGCRFHHQRMLLLGQPCFLRRFRLQPQQVWPCSLGSMRIQSNRWMSRHR